MLVSELWLKGSFGVSVRSFILSRVLVYSHIQIILTFT